MERDRLRGKGGEEVQRGDLASGVTSDSRPDTARIDSIRTIPRVRSESIAKVSEGRRLEREELNTSSRRHAEENQRGHEENRTPALAAALEDRKSGIKRRCQYLIDSDQYKESKRPSGGERNSGLTTTDNGGS